MPNQYVNTGYGIANVTKTGYKADSPDVNNPVNIIPGNRISMKNVTFPVYGIDNKGNDMVMFPGGEYYFGGDYVIEVPMRYTDNNFANQTGVSAYEWGALGSGISGLFSAAGGVWDASIMANANKQIAGGVNQTQQSIAGLNSQTQQSIAGLQDATTLEAARINACATIQAANKNNGLGSGTVVTIGAMLILVAATVGIFVYASKKQAA